MIGLAGRVVADNNQRLKSDVVEAEVAAVGREAGASDQRRLRDEIVERSGDVESRLERWDEVFVLCKDGKSSLGAFRDNNDVGIRRTFANRN